MKKFDWEVAKTKNNPAKLQWLYDNHDEPITEEQFISAMKNFKQFSNQKINKKRNKQYTPSNLKYQYHRLKEGFGFFA